MFDNLMSQMQEQAAEMKKKLDETIVEAEAENGQVKVKATANKNILSIEIANDLLNDKEAIEDLVIVAVNNALKAADEIASIETEKMSKGLLPGMGNLFG